MINIDLPPVLKLCFQQAKPGGSILTLGRQTVGFGHEAIDGYLADGLFDAAAAERLRGALFHAGMAHSRERRRY